MHILTLLISKLISELWINNVKNTIKAVLTLKTFLSFTRKYIFNLHRYVCNDFLLIVAISHHQPQIKLFQKYCKIQSSLREIRSFTGLRFWFRNNRFKWGLSSYCLQVPERYKYKSRKIEIVFEKVEDIFCKEK